jgi:predicted GIY-YIG superfamily endonuclease
VEALIKEKKGKDIVLIELELVNLKNASLLNLEEFIKLTTKAKKEKLVEENEYHGNL